MFIHFSIIYFGVRFCVFNMTDTQRLDVLRKELNDAKMIQIQKEQEIKAIIERSPVDKNLLYFYGKECGFTKKAEPAVSELEGKLGRRLNRLETWHVSENQKKYAEVGGDRSCGGVPFFYNLETKESVCGARGIEILEAWAKVKNR